MPVRCCEIKMFLTSILRDEVDHMLLTISLHGDIVQGFYLHIVCHCLCLCRWQKLWSMLNYAFGFGLCWNYDYGLSLHWNYVFGFFFVCWTNNNCFVSSTTVFCRLSLLAPIFHHCTVMLPVATVWSLHQFLPEWILVKLIITRVSTK